jgi:hypothetical protein
LAGSGINPGDQSAVYITQALRHYLAARQLNDDLHDWEKDLKAGLNTCVVTTLIKALALPEGEYKLAELAPKMQHHFWNFVVIDMCQTISKHTSRARADCQASRLLLPDNIITHLLDKIDQSVTQTLDEHAKAGQFLEAYKQ